MAKIAHTGIVVRDMEAALHFYVNVLGFVHTGGLKLPDVELAFLKGENQSLELLAFPGDTAEKPQGVISHIALEVEDLRQELARLKEHGVVLDPADIREPEGMKVIFFTGPSGEQIELVQYL
ncbi:MAG: VOC family protein [Firmicutes bacterium]|nr:VOC family protein [Bacillota bacterium]